MKANLSKNGVKARMGLFLALAAIVSGDYAKAYFDFRKRSGHPRGGYTKGHPGTGGGSKRRGMKLAKKMLRRPLSPKWPTFPGKKDSRELANARRNLRRRLENGTRAEQRDLDFIRRISHSR